MKKFLFALFLLSLSLTACQGQQTKTEGPYTYKSGDPNGIDKWYMGRQIARVMGYQGMSWLERPEREKEEKTSLLLANMNIKTDDTIADIGAGSGYHVFKMANQVKSGLIYGVDIQEEMLAAMDEKRQRLGLENIELVKGGEKSINLPANSVDKVLLVDVYHEFSYPAELLQSIREALRQDGQLYLIEYRGEDPSIPIKPIHKMTEKQAVKELKANGFELSRNIDNLPWQHCMIFVKA